MEVLEGRVTGALKSKMEGLGQEAKKMLEGVSESLEAKLDHRMNDLGSAVTIVASPSPGEYFKHIPQRSEEYLDTLSHRMDALEEKVDSRFKTLESLLGRVLDAVQAM